ncbi:MAG: dCTP deaminase [Colwellia sp.]|nr:dCTP deaminase [Colwellia sp.]
MLLSDRDIKKAINNGTIIITPQKPLKQVLGSCSYDLTLDRTFRLFNVNKYPFIDTKNTSQYPNYTSEFEVKPRQPIIIQPGGFVLASTVECVSLGNNVAARLEGRSSWGRLGIIVHSTAGLIDPGWHGKITLELGNLGVMAVALYPGVRVCALTFEQVSSVVEVPYKDKADNKYAGQQGVESSKIFGESK